MFESRREHHWKIKVDSNELTFFFIKENIVQKRKISINYGNTDDLENENGYTFLIPDDKYQNINIKYDTKDEKKKKEKKEKAPKSN